MNVGELRDALKDLPAGMEVICQKDSEGNGYSPLYGVDTDGIYFAEAPWYGEMKCATWSADDACMDEAEWAEVLKRPRCLVLGPTN